MLRRITFARSPGGGGGGAADFLPASAGHLVKAAARQFVPPALRPPVETPALPMEPTLVIDPDVRLPQSRLPQIGDPLAAATIPSGGRGTGGGHGDGKDGGIGSGPGPHYGPGPGGAGSGGIRVLRVTSQHTLPAVIYMIEPEYSDEARQAKLQGAVILHIEVDELGRPRSIQVVRGLGLGLDERAVEAVAKWKFRPAYQDGRPFPAPAVIEVNFRLL